MSVMLVPVRYAPNRGGIETLLAHTLPLLVDRGHEFVVVTGTDADTKSAEVLDGIPVYRLPFLAAIRSNRPLPMLTIARDLAAIEREHDVHLRHVHGLDSNLWWLARRDRQAPLPLVMSVHGTLDGPKPYSPVTLAALERADVVTAVSDGVRRSLVEAVPALAGRVRVIPNGIAVRRPPRSWTVDGPLLVVGRLDRQKGFDIAVRALALLAPERADLRLRVVGPGDGSGLRALARRLGVSDRVDLLGVRTPDETLDEIERASVVLVPSREIEGFSLVAVEAAQLGRPVVATRVGGLPETVLDGVTGVLVEPEDPRGLADAVRALLADPVRAAGMGDAARRAAARFDVTTCANAYAEVYEQFGVVRRDASRAGVRT